MREDVTRYRYGDEQHLDEALDRIFRFGKVGRTDRVWQVRDSFGDVEVPLSCMLLARPQGCFHRHTFITELHWRNLLQGGSKGVPRRFTPILKGVREEVQDGMYTLVSGTAG